MTFVASYISELGVSHVMRSIKLMYDTYLLYYYFYKNREG